MGAEPASSGKPTDRWMGVPVPVWLVLITTVGAVFTAWLAQPPAREPAAPPVTCIGCQFDLDLDLDLDLDVTHVMPRPMPQAEGRAQPRSEADPRRPTRLPPGGPDAASARSLRFPQSVAHGWSPGVIAVKTTMLNALAGSIPPRERVITCEEVFELRIEHRDLVALQCRQPSLEGTGEISLRPDSHRASAPV